MKTHAISNKVKQRTARRGDTIVEAVIAIAIYSIVAVLALASMNSGLKSAQKNLESTMARAAVDSQVDTLRYIYENLVKSQESSGDEADYFKKEIWKNTIAYKNTDKKNNLIYDIDSSSENIKDVITDPDTKSSCEDLMKGDGSDNENGKIFALNPRAVYSHLRIKGQPNGEISGLDFYGNPTGGSTAGLVVLKSDSIVSAPLYPRITYKANNSSEDETIANILIGSNKNNESKPTPTRDALQAQGVWVKAVHETKDKHGNKTDNTYDFYVRACWNASGEKSPTTFTTVVRLYKVD